MIYYKICFPPLLLHHLCPGKSLPWASCLSLKQPNLGFLFYESPFNLKFQASQEETKGKDPVKMYHKNLKIEVYSCIHKTDL